MSRAQTQLSQLEQLETVPLPGETHHVQGIETEGSRLWVTSVDRPGKRGLIFEFDLRRKRLIRTAEVQDGLRYHPGGLSSSGGSLWVPVAEYRANSSAWIEKRSKRTLKLEERFEVADHIGAVAVVPEGLVGVNWDARDLYVWDTKGKLLRKVPNPTGNAFQDAKFFGGQLVASGPLDKKTGAVDWLEWPSLRRVRRIETGVTGRGANYAKEGMAVVQGKLMLLPEDGPSRLFVFRLPE